MSKLPEDLILEILSWLPATIISRFRFVSKSWFNLITTSSCLVQSQLYRGSRNDNPKILVYNEDHQSFSIMEVEDDSPSPQSTVKTTTVVLPLEKNVDMAHFPLFIIGSCNGLICFSLGCDIGSDDRRHSAKYYYLWNPSTNELKRTPTVPVNVPPGYQFTLSWQGFGYDRVLRDYKIINIVNFVKFVEGNKNKLLIEDFYVGLMVYTLGTNSWRNTPYGNNNFKQVQLSASSSSGVYVNGYLHWIGDWGIVPFDIADESYEGTVPAPPGFSFMSSKLHALKGCLCVSYINPNDKHVNVWMMKDYGVKESWVKLFSSAHTKFISLEERISNLLWIYKNGEIFIFMGCGFFEPATRDFCLVYDPKTDQVKPLNGLSSWGYDGESEIYVSSLIRLS